MKDPIRARIQAFGFDLEQAEVTRYAWLEGRHTLHQAALYLSAYVLLPGAPRVGVTTVIDPEAFGMVIVPLHGAWHQEPTDPDAMSSHLACLLMPWVLDQTESGLDVAYSLVPSVKHAVRLQKARGTCLETVAAVATAFVNEKWAALNAFAALMAAEETLSAAEADVVCQAVLERRSGLEALHRLRAQKGGAPDQNE